MSPNLFSLLLVLSIVANIKVAVASQCISLDTTQQACQELAEICLSPARKNLALFPHRIKKGSSLASLASPSNKQQRETSPTSLMKINASPIALSLAAETEIDESSPLETPVNSSPLSAIKTRSRSCSVEARLAENSALTLARQATNGPESAE